VTQGSLKSLYHQRIERLMRTVVSSLARYILIVASMLAALTGAGVYFADQYEQHRIATIISREESKLEAIKSTVLIETKSHVDAVKLTSSDIDRQLANDKLSEDERLDRIAIILESLMDTKEGYDHIRILSPLGKETI
jgi:hypothetical protein